MTKFNKQFEYKNYKFNTSVELNTKIERRINGNTFHTVITNDMGASNFYLKSEVTEEELKERISFHETEAKNFVDKRELQKTSIEELLSNLCFS